MKSNIEHIVCDRYDMSLEENIFCAKRIVVDSIYKQANLEGIAVTYAQTEDIINDVNVENLTPTEINKVCCLRDGWKYLLDNIHADLNVGYLQTLHEIIARFDVPYQYLGKMRMDDVLVSGTDWRPELPDTEKMHNDLMGLLENDCITEKALKVGLYIMRVQPFKDGNKRVGSFVINKILIENGKGIFNVPVKLDGTFKGKLVDYYETNDCRELVKWMYDNCLQGTHEIIYEQAVDKVMNNQVIEKEDVE